MLQFHQLSGDQVTERGYYGNLRRWADTKDAFRWLAPLIDKSDALLASERHGDLPRWREALGRLPPARPSFDGARPAPCLGDPVCAPQMLRELLMAFHPWRKGPLRIGGVAIDAEWRSDWKWARVENAIDIGGHRVLDVGSGNGYFGWRMLGAGADCVIGIDPTTVYVMQWLACRHFAETLHNYVLPLGIECLPFEAPCFDSVFSMGVLYHRKDAAGHLEHLARLVRPGGQIVLETLVIDGDGAVELVPKGRYARMRNVWAVPSLDRLGQWLEEAGLPGGELLDLTPTTTAEQRSTEWMHFDSLEQCLDGSDPSLTVEGHPAPLRAMLLIRTNG